ncbi:transglycosylase SLT domain-containing protein [Halomonas elongata]|nr:transglycosylase SLT domain-containing protein [Halomonas elongata]WBF17671.1 transglycosylase SLT domain-containing protein [Halomonas elongata]WPU46512.1 transglycosylase SLT domain-containing protein [Halomonas elongata DSM 2581]
MRWGWISGLAMAVGLSGTAQASEIPPAYHVAAASQGVPAEVLYAIAMTESKMSLGEAIRPWPWTLNVGGKGYRYDSRDEACQALRRFLQDTRVVDVGIAQMNVRWQTVFHAGGRFQNPCDGLNPYANLEEAAAVLQAQYQIAGDWVQAAGRYHRPAGGAPAARYRRKVAEELAKLEGGQDLSPALAATSTATSASAASTSTASALGTAAATLTPDPDPDLVWRDPAPAEVTWVTPSMPDWHTQAQLEVAAR